MNNTLIRLAITGTPGRMGRQLIQAIAESKQTILCTALSRTGSIFCGMDAGKLAGINALSIIISDNIEIEKDNFDILIDFTSPHATMKYLEFCRQHHKKIIIGTTGFNDEEKKIIKTVAQEIGIVFSYNFSIGINLMIKLLEKVTHTIGKECDIEIIESHHNQKIDAPAGTALAMGETIAKVLGRNLSNCAIYDRKGNIRKREENSIGFSSIRAGDIVGEHTVMFAKIGERLEITHKTSSRMTFARGAVRAAIWLFNQKTGLFNMMDVLNINKL